MSKYTTTTQGNPTNPPNLSKKNHKAPGIKLNTGHTTTSKKSIKKIFKGVKPTRKRYGLTFCSWMQLPDWQRDNDYIVNHYVRETNSFILTFKSLFFIHNETGNIFSHLIPAILCLSYIISSSLSFIPIYPTTSTSDYIIFTFFLCCALVCFGCSSIFHWFKNHSHTTASRLNKMDYLGIVFMIIGSTVGILYYAFYDVPILRYGCCLFTFSLGMCCVPFCLSDKFRSVGWRHWRASIFVAFGLSGVIPVLIGIMFAGIDETWERAQLQWVFMEAFFYITGAVLYALRIPEKYYPGSFDLIGHSHQIFHFFIDIAAIAHTKALIEVAKVYHERLLASSVGL